MAKTKTPATQPTTAPTAPVAPQPPTTNHTLTYRRQHPGNRCSYGIDGVPGLVGFHMSMFADGKAPATITVDVALALPVAKAAKAPVAKTVAA